MAFWQGAKRWGMFGLLAGSVAAIVGYLKTKFNFLGLDVSLKAATLDIDASKYLTEPTQASFGQSVLSYLNVPDLPSAVYLILGTALAVIVGWLLWSVVGQVGLRLGKTAYSRAAWVFGLGVGAVTVYAGAGLGLLKNFNFYFSVGFYALIVVLLTVLAIKYVYPMQVPEETAF